MTRAVEAIVKKLSGALTTQDDSLELQGMRSCLEAVHRHVDKALKVVVEEVTCEASRLRQEKAVVAKGTAVTLLSDKEWVALAKEATPSSDTFTPPVAGSVSYELQQLFWSLWKQAPVEGVVIDHGVVSCDSSCNLGPGEWTGPADVLDIVNDLRKTLAHRAPVKTPGFTFKTTADKVWLSYWPSAEESGSSTPSCVDAPLLLTSSLDEPRVAEATNSAETPFGCDHCDCRFATIGSLKTHRRTHNILGCDLGTLILRNHTDIFGCDQCDRRFATVDSLETHRRAHHTGSFACDRCSFTCATLDLITRHKGNRLVHCLPSLPPY